MDPEEKDGSEVQETPEVAAETTETLTPEQIADLKKKAEVSSQNYERLKKAEAQLKALGDKPDAHSEQKVPTARELAAIAKVAAEVHEEDLDEVFDWAKFKNISVVEAHKQLKARLAEKAEMRKSAETANISPARRGPTKVTDESLLEKASKGEIPDSDDDIARLVAARHKTRQ